MNPDPLVEIARMPEAEAYLNHYSNHFEMAFKIGRNGALKVDRIQKRSMRKFTKEFQLLISFSVGRRVPLLKFKRQRGKAMKEAVKAMHFNKVKAQKYYGACFAAYQKFCKMNNRPIAPSHMPWDVNEL